MLLIEKSKNEEKIEINLNKILRQINKGKVDFEEHQIKLLKTIIKTILEKQIGRKKANEFIEKLGKEDKNMLAVLNMIDNERANIRMEGRREGKIEGKLEIVKNMLKEKLSIEQICRITGFKKSEIDKINKSL